MSINFQPVDDAYENCIPAFFEKIDYFIQIVTNIFNISVKTVLFFLSECNFFCQNPFGVYNISAKQYFLY